MEFLPCDFSIISGDDEISAVFADNETILKTRRLTLKMTQQQVADEAGINLNQYLRLENGERSLAGTSARIVLSVCAVLRINPYELFPEIIQKPNPVIEEAKRSNKPIFMITHD